MTSRAVIKKEVQCRIEMRKVLPKRRAVWEPLGALWAAHVPALLVDSADVTVQAAEGVREQL